MSRIFLTTYRKNSFGVHKYAVHFFRRVQSSTQEKNIQVVIHQMSF